MDLDGFLERQASGDWFSRDCSGAGGNDSLHDARARLEMRLQLFHGKEAFVLLHMRACTSEYAFFAESHTPPNPTVRVKIYLIYCMVEKRSSHEPPLSIPPSQSHSPPRTSPHTSHILMIFPKQHYKSFCTNLNAPNSSPNIARTSHSTPNTELKYI